MRRHEVKLYYSTFCTFEISAENEDQAIIKARELAPEEGEILSHLENWEDADEVLVIDDRESA